MTSWRRHWIEFCRLSFSGDVNLKWNSYIVGAYREHWNWGDARYGSYGLRIGKGMSIFGW